MAWMAKYDKICFLAVVSLAPYPIVEKVRQNTSDEASEDEPENVVEQDAGVVVWGRVQPS